MTAIHKRAPAHAPVHQEIGTVESAGEGRIDVRTEAGVFAARVAASCLLEPMTGDRVLLAVPPRGELYVLAVLERDADEPARLRVDAPGLDVAVARGPIRLLSGEGIDLVARGALSMVGKSLRAQAPEAELFLRKVALRSQQALASIDTLEGVYQSVETVARRFTARLERSYRFVEQSDVTRADHVDTRAESSLVLRAKDALVNARRVFKADAEQIHLG